MENTPSTPESQNPQPATGSTTQAAGACACAAWKKLGDWVFGDKAPLLAGVRLVDHLIDWARRAFPVKWYDQTAGTLVKVGHLGLVLAEATCILLGLVAAIKMSNWKLFPAGIGLGLLLAIFQYTATRFLDAGKALLDSSPSRLGSAAFLDCLAVLAEVLGLVLFFTRLMEGSLTSFFVGLALWALCDAVAFIALHPEMINLTVEGETRAGEEAIGILSFGVKALVRIVPIAFGVGAVLGSISLLIATFAMMGKAGPEGVLSALRLIAGCVLLPFLSYVVFAFYHLTIDLLRAILVLPSKLDKSS